MCVKSDLRGGAAFVVSVASLSAAASGSASASGWIKSSQRLQELRRETITRRYRFPDGLPALVLHRLGRTLQTQVASA